MKYIDHHVHTYYSPDSNADIEKYLIRAKKLKLESVMFTDHRDIGAVNKNFQNKIDYEEYFENMKKLEKEYEIPIRIGVEIGYEKNHKAEIDEFLNKYPFDFVIASIHYGHGKDFNLGDFFKGKSQLEAYLDYFKLVLDMVENFSNFDVLGHLDFIVRYGPFPDKTYEYDKYKTIIDPILKILIKKGKGIELNTSGLRSDLKTTFPKEKVLNRYRELGGEIITIGSDSHINEDYYKGIPEGIELFKSIGFNKLASFEERSIKYIKL